MVLHATFVNLSPHQLLPPTIKFSHIHVDHVVPLPQCGGNNMLITMITVIDRWTSWPEASPLYLL